MKKPLTSVVVAVLLTALLMALYGLLSDRSTGRGPAVSAPEMSADGEPGAATPAGGSRSVATTEAERPAVGREAVEARAERFGDWSPDDARWIDEAIAKYIEK